MGRKIKPKFIFGANTSKIFVVDPKVLRCYNCRSYNFECIFMTFSEYIKRHAIFSYREFCRQNYLKPDIDVDIEQPKLCALVKPALDPKPQKPYN